MSFTAPNYVPYRSAAQTDARPAQTPKRKYPLPAECPNQFAAYAFDQDFESLTANFPPAPRNTKSTDSAFGNLGDANAILTSLSEPSPTAAGLGKFSGAFHLVPQSWDDFKLMTFAFPGFPGLIGGASTRDVFTDNVLVRLHYDYFVVDKANILGGNPTSGGAPVAAATVQDSGGTLASTVYSLAEIPLVLKTNFVTVLTGVAQASVRINSLVKQGGDNIGGVPYLETLPDREYYQKWIANAVANKWASTAWDGVTGLGYTTGTASTVGQFVIQESTLQPYAGNIIARVTTYALAK